MPRKARSVFPDPPHRDKQGVPQWQGRGVGVSNSPSYVLHPAAQLAFIYFFHLFRGHFLTFILSRNDSTNT